MCDEVNRMYYFEQFSDDYFRVINQAGVHQARPWMPGNGSGA